jgi:hypothetical protein
MPAVCRSSPGGRIVTSCAQEDTVHPERCDMVGRCYFRMGSAPRVLLSPFQEAANAIKPLSPELLGERLCFFLPSVKGCRNYLLPGVPFLFRDHHRCMDEKC